MDDWYDEFERAQDAVEDLQAENDRLREENKYTAKRCLDAEEENERLRKERDTFGQQFSEACKELERLQEHASDIATDMVKAERENERLREKVEKLITHIRSESSRLVQIDSSRNAAEARLRRIEEAAKQALTEKDTYCLIAALADQPTEDYSDGTHYNG